MRLEQICKKYDDRMILDHLDLELDDHGIYCIMAPSGKGKTTLLRIMAGLTEADSGKFIYGVDGQASGGKVSMVFQEDRLFESFSAAENVHAAVPEMTMPEIRRILSEVLPPESLDQPVRELSGGMKRRVAVVRAMLFHGVILLMDEPFTGLDAAMHARMAEFVLKYRQDRPLILATHDPDDADLLGAETIFLNDLTKN